MRFRARISLKTKSLLFILELSIPLAAIGFQSHSSTIAIVNESEIVAIIKPETKSVSIVSIKDWSTIKVMNPTSLKIN